MKRKKNRIIMTFLVFILCFQNIFSLTSEKNPPELINVKIVKPYIISFGGVGKSFKYVAEVAGEQTQAFALESDKKMPGNEYVAQKLGKEDKLTHTMYFCSGYEGESILKKWLVDNGYSEHTSVNPFIALSQVLLMYANNPEHAFQGWNQVVGHKGGTLEKSYQDMIIKAYDYIITLTVPDKRSEEISFTDGKACWSEGCFKSDKIMLKGSYNNYVNYTVPSDMTLHMNGKSYDGGSTVQLKSFNGFYLTTQNKNRRNTVYESPLLEGNLKSYVPYKIINKEEEQSVCFFASTEEEKASFKITFGDLYGHVSINVKPESNPNVTDICPQQYSLKDAAFGIYRYKDDALEDKNRIKTLMSDKDGTLPLASLESQTNGGRYYLKEITPSKGFIANTKIYEFIIKENEITKLTIKSKPYVDSLSFEAKKQIKDGNIDFQKFLKGAEYTVRYYPNIYETTDELYQEKPLRTWVFKTDDDGVFRFDDKWKVNGNELFKDENKDPIRLIGTYTFEESYAPVGFEKNNGIIIRHVKNGIALDNLNGNNASIFSERVDNNYKHKITIKRLIKESDIYIGFGDGISIVEIQCKNIYGKTYTLRKTVSLKDYTLKDGYYHTKIVFDNLEAGEYLVKDVKTSRYKTIIPKEYSSNARIMKEGIVFELVNTANGEATFQSEITRWNNLSYATVMISRINKEK